MTGSAERIRYKIADSLLLSLQEISDGQIEAVQDTAELGGQMAQLVPLLPGTYGKIVGPVYSAKALETMRGDSREAISKKVGLQRLLALKAATENLFPVFQFRDGEVREDVASIIGILRPAADPFTIALWLCTPLPADAKSRTPMNLLDDGEPEIVRIAAERASVRWATRVTGKPFHC